MKKRYRDIEYLKKNFNLQLFADGGDGDTGHNGGDGNSNNGGNDKTFTQEELDNIIKGRIADTKKSTQKALLEELGIEKVEDLKAIVSAKKKADDDKKTELEKLQDQLNKANQDKDNAAAKAKQTLIIADFKVKAIEQGLDSKQIEAALKLVDITSVEVKDDGTVEGSEDVIKKVLEDYPFLKGSTNNNIGGGAGGNPGGGDGKGEKLSIGQRLAKSRKEQAERSSKKQNHYFK